jgi:hypothetical protein
MRRIQLAVSREMLLSGVPRSLVQEDSAELNAHIATYK